MSCIKITFNCISSIDWIALIILFSWFTNNVQILDISVKTLKIQENHNYLHLSQWPILFIYFRRKNIVQNIVLRDLWGVVLTQIIRSFNNYQVQPFFQLGFHLILSPLFFSVKAINDYCENNDRYDFFPTRSNVKNLKPYVERSEKRHSISRTRPWALPPVFN